MTSWEVFNEGKGVRRDYAHLAITFCRCMNILARYCTGYFGDIGVPPPCGPMDFAGWFEAYLGGRWYTFEPRNTMPRIGRVLIAQGRNAADVPITHTFGPNTLVSFKVWTDEVSWTRPPLCCEIASVVLCAFRTPKRSGIASHKGGRLAASARSPSRPRVSGLTVISSGLSELQSGSLGEPQPKNLFGLIDAAQLKLAE